MRYAELFAGAGGLSLGLERAGMTAAWHAEWSDAPRKILEAHWPDVPLYGDVSTLDGRALVQAHGAIDLLSGGSPCQDLSVAGKRAGLTGGARSSLFFQQMRLWEETGADLCLWENVVGALSSNRGEDFALVLSAFVGGAVVVPADGWRGAGVVCGRAGVAAWRILDAQFFGVPQRRRRVFVLGTRTGQLDPAEILSLPDRVRRHPSSRGDAGQRVADSLTVGANQTCGFVGDDVFDDERDAIGWWEKSGEVKHWSAGPCPTSMSDTGETGNMLPRVLAFGWQNSPAQGDSVSDQVTPALDRSKTPAVLAFDTYNQSESQRVFHTLRTGGVGDSIPAICMTGGVTHALTHEGHDASEDGTGRGTPLVVGTLSAADGKSQFYGVQAVDSGHVQATYGIPRRLMPVECERLMGWPDGWTLAAGSDAARYKACGNGVASPVAEWIGRRIVDAVSALERAA